MSDEIKLNNDDTRDSRPNDGTAEWLAAESQLLLERTRERDSLQARLQAAEADKTEWRDLYEELHVKLEAAEAERDKARTGWERWSARALRDEAAYIKLSDQQDQAKATIHELQEALERITRLPEHESQLWEHGLQREAATHALLWDAVRIARQALHPTQNEGAS